MKARVSSTGLSFDKDDSKAASFTKFIVAFTDWLNFPLRDNNLKTKARVGGRVSVIETGYLTRLCEYYRRQLSLFGTGIKFPEATNDFVFCTPKAPDIFFDLDIMRELVAVEEGITHRICDIGESSASFREMRDKIDEAVEGLSLNYLAEYPPVADILLGNYFNVKKWSNFRVRYDVAQSVLNEMETASEKDALSTQGILFNSFSFSIEGRSEIFVVYKSEEEGLTYVFSKTTGSESSNLYIFNLNGTYEEVLNSLVCYTLWQEGIGGVVKGINIPRVERVVFKDKTIQFYGYKRDKFPLGDRTSYLEERMGLLMDEFGIRRKGVLGDVLTTSQEFMTHNENIYTEQDKEELSENGVFFIEDSFCRIYKALTAIEERGTTSEKKFVTNTGAIFECKGGIEMPKSVYCKVAIT